jgi:hypothetical protein
MYGMYVSYDMGYGFWFWGEMKNLAKSNPSNSIELYPGFFSSFRTFRFDGIIFCHIAIANATVRMYILLSLLSRSLRWYYTYC